MLVTLFGIMILVKLLAENAFFPILVTGFPLYTEGIYTSVISFSFSIPTTV